MRVRIGRPRIGRTLLLTCLVLAWPAWSGFKIWGEQSSRPVDTSAEALRQGQWVWKPEAAPEGPIMVVVNLGEQRAYVYRNGIEIGYTTVSSGKRGHETPTGVFTTLQKDRDHHSSLYNSASMPYTQRLTWDGVALHAGGLPGYPSSHGCVHLPTVFAERLFEVSPLGMTVVVTEKGFLHGSLAHPSPIAPARADTGEALDELALAAGMDFDWRPELAPEGPVSILLSLSDRRVVVMRNGIEIGAARVQLRGGEPLKGTHVFVAHPAERDAHARPLAWHGVAVSGHSEDAGRVLHPLELVQLPPPLLARMQVLIGPGTSLVVTDREILPHTTGMEVTVVTNQPPEV